MGIFQSIVVFRRAFILGRAAAAFENRALRQQVVIFKQSVKRPRLRARDRVFWVWLSRLWPNWRSALVIVRLETLALRLRVADKEDHRALSDSLLLKDVFLRLIGNRRKLRTTSDLFRLCPPLGCEDAGAFAIEPPPGYEELGLAMQMEQTVVMVYDGGTKGLKERRITPRALLESRGRVYLNAYCHIDGTEKMFRLDRIREFRLEDR